MRIVAIGDNCVDYYANFHRVFPGGGALNFAVYARRAGAETGYIGVIGTDPYGVLLRQTLLEEQVDVSCLRIVEGSTAIAYVELIEGNRKFIGSNHGVRDQLAATEKIEQYLRGCDLIHTTLDGKVENEIPRWKASGYKISFDYSHRYTPQQLSFLPYLEIAFFSGQFMNPDEALAAAQKFHTLGARLVIITLGEHGSLAFDGKDFYRQSAQSIFPIDTLGAGDAYMAVFSCQYLAHGDIQMAMQRATEAASHVCTTYGAFGRGIMAVQDSHHR
jgi:fructoselysine 6-kinase